MKKLFLIITVEFALLGSVAAKKKIEGFLVTKSGDTLSVTFKIPIKIFDRSLNFERLQRGVKYYDKYNVKENLIPEDAREICFTYEGKVIKMFSQKFNSGLFDFGGVLFLHAVKYGKLKLFVYYKTDRNQGTYNAQTGATTGAYEHKVERYYLKKGTGELYQPAWILFRKNMMEYLADCPRLTAKIDDRVYGAEDLEQIVEEYNGTCD